MKSRYALLTILATTCIASTTFFCTPLFATDGVWIKTSQANWSDPASWENGNIANGIDATATFRSNTIYTVCTIDTPVTLGHFVFECPGNYINYRLEDDPWRRVQLQTTSGTPSITVADDTTALFWFPLGGSQGLDKFGPGILELNTNNNYTGLTTIHAGSLEAWSNNSLGATGIGNETVVLSGGNLTIGPYEDYDVLISENITISGPGAEHDYGALRLFGAAMFTGSITLDGDATINQNDYADKAIGKITGNIALPDGADVTFQMENYDEGLNADNFTTTVSGNISGTGGVSVIHSGPVAGGTLILSGNNTYSGGNTVSGGTTLSVSAPENLGAASNGVLLDHGTLKITGTTYTGTGRTIEIGSSGGTLDIDDASHSFEIATSLAGTGNLVKDGNGKLSLTKDCGSYTGDITIKDGTLGAGIQNSLSSQTRITIKSGAKLEIQGAEDFGSLAGDSGATVDLNGHNIRFGSDDTDATYRGSIIGTAMVKKFGTGTQTLSGNLSYTGDTEVQNGQLLLTGNNEAMTGNILIQNGAALRTANGNAISSSTRVNMESNSTFTLQDDESIGSLEGAGTVNTNYASNIHRKLSVGQDNTNSSFSGTIIGDGGRLTKLGTGTFTLSGNNTYTGKTTVSAGTLALSGENIVTSSAIEILDGATLETNHQNSLGNNTLVDINEGGTYRLGANVYLDKILGNGSVDTNGYTLGIGMNNVDSTLSCTITGTGSIIKKGTGTTILAGDNTNTGGTIVEAGTLRLEGYNNVSPGTISILNGARLESAANCIDSEVKVDVAAGGTLVFETGGQVGALSGAGSVEIPSPSSGESPESEEEPSMYGLAVGMHGSENNATFSGTISGEGYLLKRGSNSWTLASENTYTGGTIIAHGCIIAAHNQVFGTGTVSLEGGELQVNQGVTISNTIECNGGTLCGNGTVQNDLTIDQYSMVSPGDKPDLYEDASPGLLTIDGNYTQTNEGYLLIELGGTTRGSEHDALVITGGATLGGTLAAWFLEDFVPTCGDTFDILDWGSIAAEGKFDTLELPELAKDQYWDTTDLYLTGEIAVSDNTGIPGDANNDRCVDGSDVTILANNWQTGVDDGQTATWAMGDFNADGKVDGSDVTILANNWQYGVEATASAVPEPSTLLLLLTLFAALAFHRKRAGSA